MPIFHIYQMIVWNLISVEHINVVGDQYVYNLAHLGGKIVWDHFEMASQRECHLNPVGSRGKNPFPVKKVNESMVFCQKSNNLSKVDLKVSILFQ